MYPLALGRHLRGSACTRTRQTADGCTLPAAGDGSDDGAQSRGAANHLLTSARARLAGLRDGLGIDVNHLAVHTHRNQIESQLRTAGNLAGLFVVHQLDNHIRAARNHLVAADYLLATAGERPKQKLPDADDAVLQKAIALETAEDYGRAS